MSATGTRRADSEADAGGRATSTATDEWRRLETQSVEAKLPIPIGWSAVLFSDELATGAVVPIHAFGVDLVAFRSEDGEVAVLDAYCPHMGAHLGHGGVVEGDRLVFDFTETTAAATGKVGVVRRLAALTGTGASLLACVGRMHGVSRLLPQRDAGNVPQIPCKRTSKHRERALTKSALELRSFDNSE